MRPGGAAAGLSGQAGRRPGGAARRRDGGGSRPTRRRRLAGARGLRDAATQVAPSLLPLSPFPHLLATQILAADLGLGLGYGGSARRHPPLPIVASRRAVLRSGGERSRGARGLGCARPDSVLLVVVPGKGAAVAGTIGGRRPPAFRFALVPAAPLFFASSDIDLLPSLPLLTSCLFSSGQLGHPSCLQFFFELQLCVSALISFLSILLMYCAAVC